MAIDHVEPGQPKKLLHKAQSKKSTALVKNDAFEAINLIVAKGREIAPHHVDGPITLYCICGRIALKFEQTQVEMGPGDWLHLEGGTTHALQGIEDAQLILTIIYVQQ